MLRSRPIAIRFVARLVGQFVAALVLLQPALAASEALGEKPGEELQRLFFTPAQRAALDHRRRQPLPEPRQADAVVTVNGRVLRSSGAGTVWINGVAEHRRDEAGADARHVTIERPGRRVRVKVGQALDPLRGEASDAVANGVVGAR